MVLRRALDHSPWSAGRMTAACNAPQARGTSVSLLSNKVMGRRTPKACAISADREVHAGSRTGVARCTNFASRAKSAMARKAKTSVPINHTSATTNSQFEAFADVILDRALGATDATTGDWRADAADV